MPTPSDIFDALRPGRITAAFHLDRPAEMLPWDISAARGILGHCLLDAGDSPALDLFKPPGVERTPSYCFAPAFDKAFYGDRFIFHITAWGPGLPLLHAAALRLPAAKGRSFWRKAAISAVAVSEPWLLPRPQCPHGRTLCVRLVTPAKLHIPKGEWALPETFDISILMNAAARRLDNLSTTFAGGGACDTRPVADSLAALSECDRHLTWIDMRRASGDHGRNVALGGMVGSVRLARMPDALADLLAVASAFNIGKHVAEGCGVFSLEGTP